MTGRIHHTPEAEQQLNQLDDWVATQASADVAHCFIPQSSITSKAS